jgi:hypothetical protein
MKNPEDDLQRPTVIDRKSPIHVRAEIVSCINGSLSQEGPLASLIIIEVKFEVREKAHRVLGATIGVEFAAGKEGAPHPLACDIAPDGSFSLVRGDVGTRWTCEKPASGKAKVTGTMFKPDNISSGYRAARWSFTESDQKDGIPDVMQMSMLLRRHSNDKFHARFGINCQVELRNKTQMIFGANRHGALVLETDDYSSGSRDDMDPIVFDPSISFGLQSVTITSLHDSLLNIPLRFESTVDTPATVQEGFCIELWDIQMTGNMIMRNPSKLSKDIDGFRGLPCSALPAVPIMELLKESFPWVNRRLVSSYRENDRFRLTQ